MASVKSKASAAGLRALIVADAGPLIALAVAGVLRQAALLQGSLLVPQDVLHECVGDASAPGAQAIAQAVRDGGLSVVQRARISPLDAAYAQGLGTGEAAVLAYALGEGLLALIDERRARRVAQRLGVPVVGSGALLLALKREGHISHLAPVLRAWKEHGYFVAEPIRQELLRRAGEA